MSAQCQRRFHRVPWQLLLAMVPLLVCACGASAGKNPTTPTVSPQAELTPNPTPPASVSPAPASTTGISGLIPAAKGDRVELFRRWVALGQEGRNVLPEDYEYGPILTALPEKGTSGSQALEAARLLFQELKAGRSRSTPDKTPAFLDRFLTENQEAFRSVQMVRFLANPRMDGSEAAFAVRLLGIGASARVEIFLDYSVKDDHWLVSDVQGNPGLLTESNDKRYTEYKPLDIERTLIREGNAKPWL